MRLETLIQRTDGSEVKIVATLMTGSGLHQSLENYVLARNNAREQWALHTKDYLEKGLVTCAELLKTNQLLVQSAS